MADHKSALKRHRQSIKRTLRNKHYRTTVRSIIKKARTELAEKGAEAEAVVKQAIATIDRVRGKGVIPRNRASRYVSHLTQLLNKSRQG